MSPIADIYRLMIFLIPIFHFLSLFSTGKFFRTSNTSARLKELARTVVKNNFHATSFPDFPNLLRIFGSNLVNNFCKNTETSHLWSGQHYLQVGARNFQLSRFSLVLYFMRPKMHEVGAFFDRWTTVVYRLVVKSVWNWGSFKCLLPNGKEQKKMSINWWKLNETWWNLF